MKGAVPKELRSEFRNTLFVSTDIPLEEGPFSMNYQEGELMRYDFLLGKTIGVNYLGFSVVSGVAIVAIILATCNCPRVYAIDESGNQVFQGPLFSGAIAKSFEREDLLPLFNMKRDGEEIVLRVANELPEEEYLNNLRLLKVSHRPAYELAKDEHGTII